MKKFNSINSFTRAIFFFAIAIGSPQLAIASFIPIDTAIWSYEKSPSSGGLSKNDTWVKTEQNTPTKTGNSSGSLISDFRLKDNFSFTGAFSPTFASNHSCEKNNTCNDNDIIGLVFGWQNEDNHYRLGWSQGGAQSVSDTTGKSGLFLVREIDGSSNTLINFDTTFWVDEAVYTFSISRVGSELAFEISGETQSFNGNQSGLLPSASQSTALALSEPAPNRSEVITFSVTDDTFTTGNIGVYTESQTGVFSSLSAQGLVEVSAPAFSLGMMLIGLLSVRRKKHL